MNTTYFLKRKHQPREGQELQSPRHVILYTGIADVNLYFRFDRTVIVGRPAVYLAIDPFSRLVLRHSVRFEPKCGIPDRSL